MAAKSFLRQVGGLFEQIFGVVVSGGASNAGDIPALDDTGRLDNSVMPVGIGPDTVSLITTEALAGGDFINFHDQGGARVRKADAANNRVAHGFVLSGFNIGETALVYRIGSNTALYGLSIGVRYFLSATTPGKVVSIPPSTPGQFVQELGFAHSDTEITFNPNPIIKL